MLHPKSVIAAAAATALVSVIGLVYAQTSDPTTTPSPGAPTTAAPTDANAAPSPAAPAMPSDTNRNDSGSMSTSSTVSETPKADRN